MCLTAYFLGIQNRDGENTPLLYISAWKRKGKCGRKEAEKGCSGQKKRGCRQEKEMEGRGKYSYRIKMQAVRKARKDAQSGKKAHFFYRISRKEGNKGNKKTEGKRRKKARMQKKQRREKSSGDTEMPHGRRMLSENDRVFQFKPFQNCRKNKKERTERIFRNTLFDQPALSEKTPDKKKQKPASHIRLGVSIQTPRRIKKTPKHFKANA